MVNPNNPLEEPVVPVAAKPATQPAPRPAAEAPADPLVGKAARMKMGGADIGIHLIVCVLIGGALGFALDRWLGQAFDYRGPWAMLAGGLLGFVAWFRTLMKL